jgi:hypothetical protein
MPRPTLLGAAAFAGIVGATVPCTAHADPQATVGLTLGVAGRGYQHKIWHDTAFHLGLRGDVLFGRSSTHDFGVGPYAEVLTHDFDEIQVGGGGSLLLPIIDSLPLVVSTGAYGRKGSYYPFQPGLAWSLFFGSRSYNFSSSYVMTAGLLTQFRYGLGSAKESSIIIGVQGDLAFLGLPVVYLVDAIRGGSRETDRVPR